MPARACPRCKSLMDVPSVLLNRAVECPTCNATFTPDGPKMATVLATKAAAPVVPTVVSKPRSRIDEPRPRRRKQSGVNRPLVAILGGGGVLLIVAAAVGIGVYAFRGRSDDPFESSSPTRSTDAPVVNWQRVNLCENTVTVRFPGPPSHVTQHPGQHAHASYGDLSRAFEITVDFGLVSNTGADQFPDGETLAKRIGGRLIRTQPVSYAGGLGRDYEVDTGRTGISYSRMLVFGGSRPTIVMLDAIGAGLTRSDAQTFLQSLQVSPPQTVPQPPKPTPKPPVTQPPMPQPPVVVTPPKPKSDLPDGWTKYEFPDKSASAAMPGIPIAKEGELAPGIRVIAAESAGADGLTYTISYASEPTDPRAIPGTSAYILMARASLERTFNRRADRDVPAAFSGVIGREVEFRDRDGKGIRVRYYKAVKGNETRVYAIQLAGPLPDATAKTTFVDSFKISWP